MSEESKKLEYERRVIQTGVPSFVVGLEEGHIPTFWLLP